MSIEESGDPKPGATFDVTIWTTDRDRIVIENLDDQTAHEYEDLPFTTQHVAVVEVQQTSDTD